MSSIARLAKDVYVRAWPDIRSRAPVGAIQSASAELRELIPRHPVLAEVPELSLRLALAAAIQAVSEELALCPGATPFRLAPARLARTFHGLFRPELKDVRSRAWAFGVEFAAQDEAAIVLCQLLFGNWVARQAGLDHHADVNQPAIGALGRAVLVNGVRITEEVLAAHSGVVAKAR